MKIEIYKNENRLNIEDVYLKDFAQDVDEIKKIYKNIDIDFSSISILKGEKIIIEKAFQDEKAEILND
jgi:hypothetical protein